MNFKYELKKTIKTRFLSGILVIVPLFITFAILKFAILSIDNFIKPYLVRAIGQEFDFPFLGLAVTLMLIILTGILTTNVIGQKILRTWENILLKIPFFNVIYSASKKLLEGFALGFLANRVKIHMARGEKTFWSVFIASTPTPFSGIVIMVPEGELTVLDMPVEEGIKFFVSGSVAIQNTIGTVERFEFDKKKPRLEVCS
jgi:uncharacterized membrane protein